MWRFCRGYTKRPWRFRCESGETLVGADIIRPRRTRQSFIPDFGAFAECRVSRRAGRLRPPLTGSRIQQAGASNPPCVTWFPIANSPDIVNQITASRAGDQRSPLQQIDVPTRFARDWQYSRCNLRGRMVSAPTLVRKNKKTQGTLALRRFVKSLAEFAQSAKKIHQHGIWSLWRRGAPPRVNQTVKSSMR